MARRVPIFLRGEVFYYVDAAGKRKSLGTGDRREAIAEYRRRMGGAERPLTPPSAPPPPAPPPAPEPPGEEEDEEPEQSDPMQDVGGTAPPPATAPPAPPPAPGQAPIVPDRVISGAGTIATEAEVEDAAKTLAALGLLFTGFVCIAKGREPGPNTPAKEARCIEACKPFARRWIASGHYSPGYGALAAFADAGKEQWERGKPLPEEPPTA